MTDWAPVMVATVLFILLSPGLLFQVPAADGRVVGFGNFETSGVSVLVHALIYFGFVALLLVVVKFHMYVGHAD